MINYSTSHGVDLHYKMYGNALIHKSRNNALTNLRPNATHALFMDDDMLPEEDALLRLLAHGVPAVSALCTTRHHPVGIAARAYNRETTEFGFVEKVKMNCLIRGDFAVGAAFLLVDRPTIEALIEHHLSATDWLMDREKMFTRMEVSQRRRDIERKRVEAFRRERYAKDKHARIFDYGYHDNDIQMGEDLTFSLRLIQLGIPVHLDTGTPVAHVGEYTYGIWDMEVEAKDRPAPQPVGEAA